MLSLVVSMLIAAPPAEPEVDHLELAALLVRDGHYDRAQEELAALDPEAPDRPDRTLDRARYWTLRGVVALHARAHLDAAQSFERAIEHGQTDPMVPAFIAQCHLALGQWEAAAAAFARVAPEALEADPRMRLLEADALRRAGRPAEAWWRIEPLLSQPSASPEDRRAAHRLAIAVLVDAGLFGAAAEVGTRWLGAPEATLDDHLVVAESLHRARAWPEAAAILDAALLRHPDEPRLLALMGGVLVHGGSPFVAALVLERASLLDPERALDAAELYRRAGRLERALWLNAKVPDPKAKLRQRVGLLVELQRFEQVAALSERILRLGLGDDDSVAYAVAYAAFQVGDHREAERWLRRIDSPEVFDKASALLRTLAVCRDDPERCR